VKKIFVGIFLFSLLASCSLFTRKAAEKPIATAYGKDLYLSQILEIFPDGISKEDSVQFLKNYTESWVKKQVTLNKAEANLTVSQKNVDQLLDDYRTSLLIYKYEEKFIQQKLDTVVTNQEVTDFYNSNKSNLILMNSIVKALYIKLKNNSPVLEKVKAIYRSNKSADIKQLDDLCLQGAQKYDYFNEQWVPFSIVLKEIPYQPDNQEDFLRRNQSLEFKDSLNTYLVNIKDYMMKGEVAPLGYEKQDIKMIILNQRKQVLIKDLESKIYNEALNHGQFKVFVQ
jgi:hypothetical protein